MVNYVNVHVLVDNTWYTKIYTVNLMISGRDIIWEIGWGGGEERRINFIK